MPEISVIIPIHNGEETIEKAVESVLAQDFEDFELLLINHNSEDGTSEICDRYSMTDSRVRRVDVHHGSGAGVPRNLGMDCSSSPYIFFLDADDRMASGCLRKLYHGIRQHNSDICIGGFRTFVDGQSAEFDKEYTMQGCFYSGRQQVRIFTAERYPDMILGVPWNKLYRKAVIDRYRIQFPEMRRLEDGIFNLRYFDKAQSVEVIPDIVTIHMESAQVEKGKLGSAFFDEMRCFVGTYYRYLKRWGLKAGLYEQKIGDYYHNDLISLLEKLVWSEKCTNLEIRRIRDDRISRKMLSIQCRTGRYTRIAIFLLKTGRFGMLRILIKLKRILKVCLPGFFYLIRKMVNR